MEKIASKVIESGGTLMAYDNIAIVSLSFCLVVVIALLIMERRDRKEATDSLVQFAQVLADLETAIKVMAAKL